VTGAQHLAADARAALGGALRRLDPPPQEGHPW
jgi:hypothetical protein